MTSLLTRPQVGIERLPAVRRSNAEQRESMNCKSCRKRKIKCNRLRPTCEACNIFQCACVYDAVPKKRGPKTDVLEALLTRVDGLEKQLRDEKKSNSLADEPLSAQSAIGVSPLAEKNLHSGIDSTVQNVATLFSPIAYGKSMQMDRLDILIDLYFLRIQDKPFHILDEQTVRQGYYSNRLPQFLRLAIYARSVPFTNRSSGYSEAGRLSEEYAIQARTQVDVDEPSIENLQALLLLHSAFYAIGKSRKAYMLLSNAIGMAIALGLHREAPTRANLTANERELRRQLFWTCYVMDRFASCGSKRPSLLADQSLLLRLPSWAPSPKTLPMEGELFSAQKNMQYALEPGRSRQGSMSMLIDITRILGVTNRYLAAGGVKGDSHFPWHTLSNLSRIRQDLDIWAQGNEDHFADVTALATQSDSCVLMLSKLIYHLIHCLIYRPFLPIDLAELQGTAQHQSWQIEATSLCFMHANAIVELTELGRQTPNLEWPAFTGYCLCTSGTVHVHGIHYKGQEEEMYSSSAEYLSKEMRQLSELRLIWASIQQQRDTLQTLYMCHSELVKSLMSNSIRFYPVFHLEDFFDRYPGHFFDGAYMNLSDTTVDAIHQSMVGLQSDEHGVDAASLRSTMPPINSQMFSSIPQPIIPPKNQNQRNMNASLQSPTMSGGYKHEKSQSHHSTAPKMPRISETNIPQNDQRPNILGNPFSSPYRFSTVPQGRFDSVTGMPNDPNPAINNYVFDPSHAMQPALAPGDRSQSCSTHTNDTEKDPFLTLLEHLTENEHSRGGPSDLDYYLDAQEGRLCSTFCVKDDDKDEGEWP